MFELTINNTVYEFNFGMGFVKEINKTATRTSKDIKGGEKNVGLQMAIAGIMDGDVEDLEKVLLIANKGKNPRVTVEILDGYIDDPDTDIDQLFKDVLDFFELANSTKKTVETLRKALEEAQKNQ